MKNIIKTDRLLIKPRSLADLNDCIAMDRDKIVTRYIDGPWDDAHQHKEFVLTKMNQSHPYPFGYWSIFDNKFEEKFLGWVFIITLDNEYSQAEIGWRFIQSSWGKGIAFEAITEILELVENQTPALKIIAYIDPNNMASIKLAKKCGMHQQKPENEDKNQDLVFLLPRLKPDSTP